MTEIATFIHIHMPLVAMAQSTGQDHPLGSAFYPYSTRQIRRLLVITNPFGAADRAIPSNSCAPMVTFDRHNFACITTPSTTEEPSQVSQNNSFLRLSDLTEATGTWLSLATFGRLSPYVAWRHVYMAFRNLRTHCALPIRTAEKSNFTFFDIHKPPSIATTKTHSNEPSAARLSSFPCPGVAKGCRWRAGSEFSTTRTNDTGSRRRRIDQYVDLQVVFLP
jgi:hypothetical protein